MDSESSTPSAGIHVTFRAKSAFSEQPAAPGSECMPLAHTRQSDSDSEPEDPDYEGAGWQQHNPEAGPDEQSPVPGGSQPAEMLSGIERRLQDGDWLASVISEAEAENPEAGSEASSESQTGQEGAFDTGLFEKTWLGPCMSRKNSNTGCRLMTWNAAQAIPNVTKKKNELLKTRILKIYIYDINKCAHAKANQKEKHYLFFLFFKTKDNNNNDDGYRKPSRKNDTT